MKVWWKVALKGSAASVLAFMVAVGCDDEGGAPVTGDGGEGGMTGSAGSGVEGGSESQGGGDSGGTSSGASAGMGGFAIGGYCAGALDGCGAGTGSVDPSDGGAAGQGTAGAGGSGEPAVDPDASVARFCNGISDGGQNVTFILEIGEGDEKVTFTADSFTCAPPDGQACASIPLGLEVPVALYQQGDPVPWYEATLFSEAQDQWLLYTILQTIGDDVVPSLDGTPTNGVIACDDTTYQDAYPPQ